MVKLGYLFAVLDFLIAAEAVSIAGVAFRFFGGRNGVSYFGLAIVISRILRNADFSFGYLFAV